MKVRRYDMRIPTSIKVKVRGEDREGNRFEQTASTVNVSRSGARLEGIGCLDSAQTIEVRRGWFRKARFRVVWAGMPGTPESGQIGVRLLENDATFWGIPFPAPQVQTDYVPAAARAGGNGDPIPVDWTTPKAAAATATPWPSDQAHAAASYPATSDAENTFQRESEIVSLTWQAPAAGASRTIRERVASVVVRFTGAGGETHEESCPAARVLRDKSCIVPMKTALREGTEVTIVNARNKAERPATVSMCGPQLPDNSYPIAIDLPAPDTAFWGSGNVH